MSSTADEKQEPKTTFIEEVFIIDAITIPIIGKARKYVDNDGAVFAEVDYNIEVMENAIDRKLLPVLEELIGINHVRFAYNNKPIKIGGILLGFRHSIRDKDYCFKFKKENKK